MRGNREGCLTTRGAFEWQEDPLESGVCEDAEGPKSRCRERSAGMYGLLAMRGARANLVMLVALLVEGDGVREILQGPRPVAPGPVGLAGQSGLDTSARVGGNWREDCCGRDES